MSGRPRSAGYELRMDAGRFETEQLRDHLVAQSPRVCGLEATLARNLSEAVERQVGSADAAAAGRVMLCASAMFEQWIQAYTEAIGRRPDAAAATRIIGWAGCNLMAVES